MPITTDVELRAAAEQAGTLLQEIQNYVGRNPNQNAQVRFPRGFIRTAAVQRARLGFVADDILKTNLSYALMLSDVIYWMMLRTDIATTAKDMLVKLYISLGGNMIESITKEYLHGICGRSFKRRSTYLVDAGVLPADLKIEIDWVWDMRNNMHLFDLEATEYENEYTVESHNRCTAAFKALLDALNHKGRLVPEHL